MSELDLIRQLVARFGVGDRLIVPSGDDAAVADPRGRYSVTSIDAVVDGVHFTSSAWPIDAIGRKAVAAALSDLAAMGAEAGEIYVAAGIPEGFAATDFERLTDGIAEATEAHGAVVAGGDLVRAGELWLSVTVVGYVADADAIVTRSGATAGDIVVVTGTLGGSARALELIEQGELGDAEALAKQLRPRAQLAAGQALAAAGASAMLDISDGLAGDALHVAGASEVGLTIELAKLPLAPGVDDPSYAATSGEEYELLATIAPAQLKAATAAVEGAGAALTVIGSVEVGGGLRLVDASGHDVELRGFDHFD